ncbi:unnamed protein product [Meloidogyne enterolobii]|uniref:Uncharacterized protein n=1 Tax=Meloidogyne enterolobii TaxID=390850 RepID=A0ACB0YGD4_MELEN
MLTAKNNQQLIPTKNSGNLDSELFKGETTTISTIAVRAEPHSTLVVALLKSINYVDFRIDEMQPGLLEIGKNPQDNTQLLLIHTDLFQRLLEKHQQVDDLLARAEQIASEQTEVSDVIVYEAMANGLATAWRGLSRQLEMRGYILSDTKRLYELALKQEELAKLLNSRLQSTKNVKIDSHETIIDGKSAYFALDPS